MDKVNLLNKFQNNVLCRRESNQHKASTIWSQLKLFLTKEEIYYINDDWIHFMLNQVTIDQFGQTIKNIKLNYE